MDLEIVVEANIWGSESSVLLSSVSFRRPISALFGGHRYSSHTISQCCHLLLHVG